MAFKKEDKNNELKNDNENQVDNSAILEMMKGFQEQLDAMKEQNDKLKLENENLKNQPIKKNNKDEFDPNQLVTIRNLYPGLELNLKIDDYGRIKTLKKFGGTIKVRLLEAKDIYRLNQRFAELGHFVFDDRELVSKEFDDLEEHYEKFVDHKILKQIHKLPVKELGDIFKNANLNYQKLIVDKFISEWSKGEIIEFRDQNKINLLSDLADVDIMQMINNVGQDDNLRNEYMKK